jgi:type 1 glutamine amidotransferase
MELRDDDPMNRLLILVVAITLVSPLPAANIVMMIGEDEYRTWDTLPEFAETEMKPLGHHVTVIQADKADKNDFPGLIEALRDADLLLVSVRRRQPPKEQLDAVRAHVAAGRPLVGIRTAGHAFALLPKATLTDPRLAIWPEFDPEVLGGHYSGHSGRGETDKTEISPLTPEQSHPVLRGLSGRKFIGNGCLYKVSPLASDCTPLLTGVIPAQPAVPAEPVAWTRVFGPKKMRVFYTSLGHWDDFAEQDFRTLLSNGIAWALEK